MQAPFADPLSGLEGREGLIRAPLRSAEGPYKELPLVGRETEMYVIRALLDTVALNRPSGARALTISGEIGVGKSRLLAEMFTEARKRGFRVLEGRTYESGRMFPYLPFIEALRPVLYSSPSEDLRRYMGLEDGETGSYTSNAIEEISLIGTPMVTALAGLFPDLPKMLQVTVSHEMLSPDQEKFRLFDAVATLLERMAMERPVLLGIDNLQWADSASLELTMYLTVRLHSSFVALVGVTRPPGTLKDAVGDSVVSMSASTTVAKALGELMRQGLLLLLPLGPLSTEAAAQHLQALLPGTFSESLAQALLTRAEGNPFFLEELVRMLTLNGQLVLRDGSWKETSVPGTALPDSIMLAVAQRLSGLSQSCHELLQVASLFGRTFPLPALIAVLEQNEEQVQSLVDEATSAAVIAKGLPLMPEEDLVMSPPDSLPTRGYLPPRQDSTTMDLATYMFCQGLVQEALSIEVPAHKARSLHGAIGAALEAFYGGAAIAHAAELARHYALSGEKAAALRWSLLAGEDAARQQAHREAITHFRLALKLLDEGVNLESVDMIPSRDTNLAPAKDATTFPSPARLHISIGESWFKLGELEQAAKAFQQAIELLRDAGRAGGQILRFAQDDSGAQDDSVIEDDRGAQDDSVTQNDGATEDDSGAQDDSVTENDRGTQDDSEAQDKAPTEDGTALLLAQANRLMADVCRMQGKYELAVTHLQSARAALDATTDTNVGAPAQQSGAQNQRNKVERISILLSNPPPIDRFASKPGPWVPGGRFFDSTGVLNRERVSVSERILFLQAQATLDILLNHGEEAEKALWDSYWLATEIGDRGGQAFALHLVGWLRSWGEQIYEAIRLQEQAHELYVAIGDPFRATLGDQGLGIIYQSLGKMEQARLHNLRGLERARRYGVLYSLGWLYWNQGVLALALGEWTNSESHLQQAMQEAEATNNARLKPMVMQAQAELQFRKGNWREAEQLFRASVDAAANTEWFPGTLALYGHFLAVTGRRAGARVQLDRAAALPETPGYGGQFYIPFLAEGYLHLGENERATTYIERIRSLRGFMYYGISVDRILGVVATLAGDWETAEQAFEDGLALCHRSGNVPEEASILYEQARAALMQGGVDADRGRLHDLCERARALFLEYGMQRAADMVDTLREGVRQLELSSDRATARVAPSESPRLTAIDEGTDGKSISRIVHEEIAPSEYQLELHLTRRELEVLRLVAEGHTDREVAETLVISHRTVNRHLSNIFVKLDVPGRAAAVAYAIRQGLVG